MSALITPAQLSEITVQVKILDCTYGTMDARGGYARAHIGDAQFFDIDEVADPLSKYAHTLPKPEDFAAAVGAMGIGSDDMVVVYDQTGIAFAAARVWWMFRVMGHENVKVLNGGLPAWLSAGLPVRDGEAPVPAPKVFVPHYNGTLVRHFEDMEETGDTVLDARGTERFNARIRGADGDVIAAHIPGSKSLPFAMLLDQHGAMKDADACAAALYPQIEPGAKLTATCGSGVTACVLALGFYEAGIKDVAVYGGSWTEWSDRNGIR